MPGKVFNSNLGYWEFDIFTGWAGLLFIILCGIILMLVWYYREKKFPVLIVPVIVLAIFSIDENFFKALFYNPVLVSSERVTSRMIGLALVMLIILAAIFCQRIISTKRQPLLLKIAQIILLLFIAKDLVLHTLRWSLKNAFLAFPTTPRDLSLVHISNHADPSYFTVLIIGSLISVLTMVVLIILAKKYPSFPVDPPVTG